MNLTVMCSKNIGEIIAITISIYNLLSYLNIITIATQDYTACNLSIIISLSDSLNYLHMK